MEGPGIGLKENLIGWKLEKRWKDDRWWGGVCVFEDEFVVVKEKRIKWYGMDGKCKSDITCKWLEKALDVEVLEDEVYISDQCRRVVIVSDKRGRKKREMCLPESENRLSGFLGLAVDRINKDIYVCSEKTNTVYKWESHWQQFIPVITKELSGPRYMCVTQDHHLVVSNWKSHRVTTYTSEGDLVWTYGSVMGSGKRQLSHPQGVCTDNKGHIIISDCCHNRLAVITEDKGEHISYVDIGEKIVGPTAVSFKNETLVVTTGNYEIYVIKGKYT